MNKLAGFRLIEKVARDGYSWMEKQRGANRAMRSGEHGLKRILATDELVGKRMKGGLEGAIKGVAPGVVLGLIAAGLAIPGLRRGAVKSKLNLLKATKGMYVKGSEGAKRTISKIHKLKTPSGAAVFGKRRYPTKAVLGVGAVGGAVSGALLGETAGGVQADKEFLAEKGIKMKRLGFGLEFSPAAEKKFLRKKFMVKD